MTTHPILAPLPEAILFDADGTLYESERLSFEASRLTALELHDFELPWEMFKEHVIKGSKNTNDLFEMHGLTINPERLQLTKRGHMERLIEHHLKPMPGMLNFLGWCSQYAVRCVVVSANRRTAVEAAIQKLVIGHFFADIITFEDIGHKWKPDPHPYQLGLVLAGVTPDKAFAIEDTAKGIASAQSAGLRCVGMLNETNSKSELIEAELIISDYNQLLNAI